MADKLIKDLGKGELQGELLGLRKEQFNLRIQSATGQMTNPARFKAVRREIARIKTRMNEIERTQA